MIVTSTLSNFVSNLKNHYSSKKLVLKQKKTKQIVQLVDLLVKEGLICGYYFINNNIVILLKYNNNEPGIYEIKTISKPGKRVYINNKWIYKNNSKDIYIISTQKGFLTKNEAQELNVGGELICKIN